MLRTPREPCKVHASSNTMMRERSVRSGLVTGMALPSVLFEERPLQHDDAIPLNVLFYLPFILCLISVNDVTFLYLITEKGRGIQISQKWRR